MAAGNAIIGALRVVLGADTADFEKGLKSAQASLASFGAGAGKALAVAGAAMSAAAIGLGVAIKSTINEADKLGKMSQKVGVPVEELSALKYAASLADVSIEALGKGLGKLSKTMVEAAAKPTSEAANAFRALGVSVVDSDGRLKSSSQVMSDVAEKFSGLKDGAGKTAVSMALFGKSGAELIPLLNEGKAGLEKLKAEAASFGVVIDTKTYKAAEAFNDNLTRLGAVLSGGLIQFMAGMANELKNISDQAVILVKGGDLAGWGKLAGEAFTSLLSGAATLSLSLQRLGVEWEAFKKLFTAVPFTEASRKAWDDYSAAGAESTRQLEALRTTLATAGLKDAFGDIATGTAKAATSQKDFNYAAMAGKNALDQFIASQQKSIAGQQAELQTIGMAAGAKESLKITLQGLQVATAANIPITEAMRAKLAETATAAGSMALMLGNISLIGEANPFLALQLNLDATKLKLEEGGLSVENYARLTEQAGLLQQKIWTMSAASVGSSMESIGSSLSQMSDNWGSLAKVGKAIGAIVAFINSYIAASNALATAVFPANIAIAAGVLAHGLSMVAAIKSAAIPKAAMGGAFTVPGGIGGGDRVRAMIDLEPGEFVEVSSNRPGGYQSGGSGGSTQPINIIVRGKLFDRDSIEEIIGGINSALGDNHQIKFAMS